VARFGKTSDAYRICLGSGGGGPLGENREGGGNLALGWI
jgi:hypothetical protein